MSYHRGVVLTYSFGFNFIFGNTFNLERIFLYNPKLPLMLKFTLLWYSNQNAKVNVDSVTQKLEI